MSRYGKRLNALEAAAQGHGQSETIIVNPLRWGDEPMTPEEHERHRLDVLRVARNPAGVLIEFGEDGDDDTDPLLELLGEADYATLPRRFTKTIERAYGQAR